MKRVRGAVDTGGVFALLIALLVPAASAAQDLITLDDVHRVADITEPVFSTDGTSVLYTLTTHNLEEDASTSDIWSVAYAGGEAVNLTASPKTSEWRALPGADDAYVYFLSDAPAPGQDEDAATTQVWRRAASSAVAPVTAVPGGVSDYDLSPDGARLVVVAEVGSRVGLDPEETAPPIVIDRFTFKEDGRGYLDDRRQQLFLVDVASGEATQLTSGEFDNWLPEWSPDGAQIAFVSKRTGDPDRNFDFGVFVTAPEPGAEPRAIGVYPGADNDPTFLSRLAWSPDGGRIAWLRAGEDRWIWYTPNEIALGDVASGRARLPAVMDRWLYHPRWSPDGATLYALLEDDRVTTLVRFDPEAEPEGGPVVEQLTHGLRFAYDFAVGPGGELVVLDGSDDAPFELRAIPLPEDSGAPRVLTHHNDWLAERRLAPTQEVSARSDGFDIHGFLVTPPDWDGATPLPLIVRLHGGPVYQYSHEFMFDWQLYAAQGYAVLGVNPRGSSGRGFEFAREIFADWGDPDVDDVLALVDEVVTMGVADPDRLGVGGWSYGGILTDYVIASDTRFKAAISGAGIGNMFGGYGVDQYALAYELELGLPWEQPRAWRRVSFPFLQADDIDTPTLFLCAEADDNVPCLGSEQMYQALKSRGVDTRLVVYPEENHGLTVPSYIRDRLQRSLDWYGGRLSAPAETGLQAAGSP